jgi:para-nitrobenzyl esterase
MKSNQINPIDRIATKLAISSVIGASFAVSAALAQDMPRTIDGGKVSGVPGRDPSVLVFKGIPYGAPPVGNLRWRAPQPVKPWSGVKVATEVGPACVGRNFGSIPAGGMSENCLYLNVWTPTHEIRTKLPVLVWIHGGGFQGGSGYHPSYEGEEFARQGVVVVTFNYRVGVLGFLAHPELSRETAAHASGNFGMLDQIAALKWVQRNISQFGGDPAKVTIAGESAGAYSVSALTTSPMAQGLFRAAIAESGAFMLPKHDAIRSLASAEEIGLDFMKQLGASNIEAMRALSADQLMKAVEQMPDFFAFQPCIDGEFLTEPVYSTYAKNKQAKMPLLIGNNTDEGAFLIPPQRSTTEALQARIDQVYAGNGSLVRSAYPSSTPDELLRSELNLYADDGFNYPMWKWAELQNAAGLPVYFYIFGRVLPPMPGQKYKEVPREKIGAFHGDEVPYVFGNLDRVSAALDMAPRKGRWEPCDYALSNVMLQYWANFVKKGNPDGRDLPVWPQYKNGKGDNLMYFDHDAQAVPDRRVERLEVLDRGFQSSAR